MNTIEVNLHVNISLNEDVKSFLTGLFGGNKQEQPTQQVPAAKPAQPASAPKPTAKPAPASVAKPAPAPATKPAEKPAESGLKIEDVRALLMQKVNDHRSEIKEKLSELGAKSVSTLDPEKYQEMVDYLNSL